MQAQIAGLKKFLRTEFTSKKQLEEVKNCLTDDGVFTKYQAIIAPVFEKINVDSVFRKIREQIKICEEELSALVSELEQYES